MSWRGQPIGYTTTRGCYCPGYASERFRGEEDTASDIGAIFDGFETFEPIICADCGGTITEATIWYENQAKA